MNPVRTSDDALNFSYGQRDANVRTVWSGFRTYREYLGSPGWRRLRQKAIHLHGCLCWCCGDVVRYLELHHLSYDTNTLSGDNLCRIVPLCPDCHHGIEFKPGDRGLVKTTLAEANTRLIERRLILRGVA